MKFTTQVAWVVGISVVAIAGLVIGLAVLADWSDGAIIGMVGAIGGLLVNTIIVVRNQQVQGAKLDEIAEHTNGTLSKRDDSIAALTAMNRQQAQMIADRDRRIDQLQAGR